MGCTLNKQQDFGLPVYNMVVIGYSGAGKTSIIDKFKGTKNSQKEKQLQITSFRIAQNFKILTFEVSGKAWMTWYHYYSTSRIILYVIDITDRDTDRMRKTLKQIDNSAPDQAIIFVILNKSDLLLNPDSKYADETVKQLINEDQTLSIKFMNQIGLQDLHHNIYTFKCSAKKGVGVKNILIKLAALINIS